MVETHATYLGELREGEGLRVTTRLLDHDAKRLHFIHCMRRGADDTLVATNELLFVNVDVAGGRATAFTDEMLARLDAIAARQRHLPVPEQAGRMAIRRREGTA